MRTRSLDEFNAFAREFAASLKRKDSGATIVTLSGELGAGKTTFVQEVARFFGIEERVTSPTFVIEKIYELSGAPFERLIHIDAYRLKSARELELLGWEEISGNSFNLILLEWPERVPELIPSRATGVRFDIDGDSRMISIDGSESSKKGSEEN